MGTFADDHIHELAPDSRTYVPIEDNVNLLVVNPTSHTLELGVRIKRRNQWLVSTVFELSIDAPAHLRDHLDREIERRVRELTESVGARLFGVSSHLLPEPPSTTQETDQ